MLSLKLILLIVNKGKCFGIFIGLLLATIVNAFAGRMQGIVSAAGSQERPLVKVRVENLTTHEVVYTDDKGFYTISVKKSDRIEFSSLGFKSVLYTVQNWDIYTMQNIVLAPLMHTIDTVVIYSGPSKHQQDSIEQRSVFGNKVTQAPAKFKMSKQQTFGVLTFDDPISAPYQKLSKKYRRLRAFQARFKADEREKYVNTRYNVPLIMDVTGLNSDSAWLFYKAFTMPFDYANSASNTEIKMWIKFNFKNWHKSNNFPPESKEALKD